MHVDEHEGHALGLWEGGQCGPDVQRGLRLVEPVMPVGGIDLRQGLGGLLSAEPVDGAVDGDPVQPRRDSGIASEPVGAPERSDEGLLHRIGSHLRVADRAQSHRPHPVPVAPEELTEGIGIAGHVPGQEVRIRGFAKGG